MYNVVELPDSMEGTHQVAPAADEMQPLVTAEIDRLVESWQCFPLVVRNGNPASQNQLLLRTSRS
jgi:hypothetical protein